MLTKKLDLQLYYIPVSDAEASPSSPVSYTDTFKAALTGVSVADYVTLNTPHRMRAGCLWRPVWREWIRGTVSTLAVWELPSRRYLSW